MNNDPFAVAVEDAERGFFVYGQAQATAEFVVLAKGQGKRTWVEGKDDPKDRSAEITIVINPIAESNFTKLVTRSMVSGSMGEFAKIVWPSLRDVCGVTDMRQLEGKFVKAELVKNGRKWKNRNGEEQEGTTFKFHAVYTDEAACVAGYNEDGNAPRTSTPVNADAVMDIDMSAGAGSVENPEKETAWAFMQTLIKQAGGDKSVLEKLLGGMPMITKYFTPDSPEVAPLLKAA